MNKYLERLRVETADEIKEIREMLEVLETVLNEDEIRIMAVNAVLSDIVHRVQHIYYLCNGEG